MLSRLAAAARAQRPCVAAPIRIKLNAAAASKRTLTTMLQSAAAFRFAPLSVRSSSPNAVATTGASSASSSRRLHSSVHSQQQQEQQQPSSRFEGPPGWIAPPRPPADFADRYPPLRMPAAPTPWNHRDDLPPAASPPWISFKPVPPRVALRRMLILSFFYFAVWAWGTAPDAEDEKAARAARLSSWPRWLAKYLGVFFEDMIALGFTSRKHFPQIAEWIYPRGDAQKRVREGDAEAKKKAAAAAAAAATKAKEAESKKKDGK